MAHKAFFLILGFCFIFALDQNAEAARTVSGYVRDMDGNPLPGVLVEVFDKDAFPHGDMFPPLPVDDPDDLMGRGKTSSSGYYEIVWERPHGDGAGGGYWDSSPSHGLTRWRPDTYIQIKVPSDGFCAQRPSISQANTIAWRYSDTSQIFYDWPNDTDLNLNFNVRERFNTFCDDVFGPMTDLMESDSGALRGFVDMHAHPMTHLAFGGKLIHGAPDIGSTMPAGMFECGPEIQVTKIGEALSQCEGTHGTPFDIICGDLFRNIVIGKMEESAKARSVHGDDIHGYPDFHQWPHRQDITHQFMWVDWIERAYRGGLRVMVALATNSETLTEAVTGSGDMPVPFSDRMNGRLQIQEIVKMVDRHSFMEIAYDPGQLRDIVNRGKLAVVLGIELDDFMDLPVGADPTEKQIRESINDWHQRGVRYIFPVHVTDNAFGGSAVYQSDFAMANRRQFGEWYDLKCSSRFDFQLKPSNLFENLPAFIKIGQDPTDIQPVPVCSSGQGHQNRRGLQSLGKIALNEMMRLGMIIDIDHMSEATVDTSLDFAGGYQYPLNSGHSGFPLTAESAENSRTTNQYLKIKSLGGLAGMGWSGQTAESFRQNAANILRITDGIGVAFGTDANGLVIAPKHQITPAQRLSYTSLSGDFPQSRTGTKIFDYNVEGVAHYGMIADFNVHLRIIDEEKDSDVTRHLFRGAENFARMWEKAESLRDTWPAVHQTLWLNL